MKNMISWTTIGVLIILAVGFPIANGPAQNKITLQSTNVILTPGTTTYRSLSQSNCFSVLVNMTVLNNSTTIQTIAFQSFYILVVLANQPVANTTNTSFFSPNNLLTSIILFPPSPNPIPVVMRISYNNVCLPNGTNPATDIKLAYYDGITYQSWSPTFGSGNTITWS